MTGHRRWERKGKPAGGAYNGEAASAVPYPYQAPVPVPPAYPAPAPSDWYTVSISVLSSHGATVARASYYGGVHNPADAITTSGEAKREPGDEHDPETGRLLASARALEALAARLRKRADSRIRNADAIRRHHEEIRKRDKLRGLAGTGPAAKGVAAVRDHVRGQQ